uniref:phenylacetic acid degradation operon negative regulatory protein PaaX n=1 Tax=Ningiella ruwaisensis TaxID=2364274 RepID=UPI001445BB2A|nr:phenylacetic acid degradation operon negative regulatory protein PaaX [Ningiella ruwaisensis]
MQKFKNLQNTLIEHIKDNNISCTSITSTLFGDLVSQHGNWIWLGSLIEAMAPLGFNERSVRTSVYRLVQSNWLEVNKIGRKSYYCYTETARRHSERVARRIYIDEPPEWDGSWLLVLPVSVPEEQRDEFKKSLIWQGFNTLTNGFYAHPTSDRRSLDETLVEQKLTKDVVVFSATLEDLHSKDVIKGLVNEKWNMTELEGFYQNFLEFYRSLHSTIDIEALSPEEGFMLRSILIHDYRRIQLRDPDLPDELLPNGWVGYEARDLLKRLYKMLVKPSLRYTEENLYNAHGTLPSAASKFFNRLGGLK